MEKHTVELLEFDKIQKELSGYCRSSEGVSRVLNQDFIRNSERLNEMKTLVRDYRRILEAGGRYPDTDFPPVADILDKLDAQGAVFEPEEAARLGRFLRSAAMVKKYLLNREDRDREEQRVPVSEDSPLLESARAVPDMSSTVRTIFSRITESGEIDETIPALKKIRQRIQAVHREIDGIAAEYLRRNEYRGYWQNDVPGQKEGRTVLPLKSAHRGRIQGIVHEVSSTGATLFIEPMEIVERNNQLTYENNLYRKEVHRILRELTESLRPESPVYRQAVEAVSYLDAVYARSRYSIHRKCYSAVQSSGDFILNGARHPLLGDAAVPVTINLSEDTRCLVISGPNTGGKTVGLKTAGLFVLMNQFGMDIPAAEDSRLPLFDSIFADIGDEQSIEYSLSTFSGHMTRISRICDACTDRSLVLLDELGSGTDFEEGAAIAMAVLDYLREKNTTTLVSTHQSILKNYAFSRKGAENASVEFDPVGLKPLYRILPGIPGESHAVDIAEQVGMNDLIIRSARQYREGKKTDVSQMIEEISAKQQELAAREYELEEQTRRQSERERDFDEKEAELAAGLAELRTQEATELKNFITESRKRFENLVRELREGELKREEIKQSKEFIENLEKKRIEEEQKGAAAREQLKRRREPKKTERDRSIEPGGEVLVGDHRRRGTVVRKGKGSTWIVAVGNLKIEVPEEEISPSSRERKKKVTVEYETASSKPALVLDLRGMRYEEAAASLRTQIEQAVMNGLTEFEVIHGKGEGVLQKAVHDVLADNDIVDKFQFAEPDAGGYGKTIVYLRNK